MSGKNIMKYITFLFWFVLTTGILTSCKDEIIMNTPDNIEGSDYYDAEEVELQLSLFLGVSGTTRAEETKEGNIDNYINSRMVQVLFFTKEGDFLFKGENFRLTESGDKNGQWYLRVPLNNSSLTDQEGKSILALAKAQLEKEPFKIAILANWATEENKPYNLDWGWKNSLLYQRKFNAADEETKNTLKGKVGEPDLKNVNDLHHLEEDTYYSNSSRRSAYTFILDNQNRMGVNNDWVKMRDLEGKELNGDVAWHNTNAKPQGKFSKTEEAYTWIKNNWDPSLDNLLPNSTKHTIYRHYCRLWYLWNFGANFSDNKITYSDLGVGDKFASKWNSRNGQQFSEESWCMNDNHLLDNQQHAVFTIGNDTGDEGLTIISADTKDETTPEKYIRSYNGTQKEGGKDGYYGIVLPQMDNKAIEDNNPSNLSKHKPWIKESSDGALEYMKFKVPGTGKLRVVCSSYDENESTLIVQRGANWEMTYNISGSEIKEIGSKDKNKTNEGEVCQPYSGNVGYTVKLTQGEEDIILWCLKGSIVVHAIEFVCDDYLAGTDREGIMPTEDYPIPMFGIQEFPEIDAWGSQEVMNLPNNIYLIRGLAKIELYLPAGTESISHVYMRSMNRKARLEPVDVLSSTGDLWKSHVDGEGECEWFRICEHGSGYKEADYKGWYGWFYGSWTDWWTKQNNEFPKVSFREDPPQLFNADVERSDFCHFIMDDKYPTDTYHRFFLYVPDKCISDPNTPGNLSSTPKVAHIEYRHGQIKDYLDDNNCYRIYFTDYSTNGVIKTIKTNEYETIYEASEANLNLNWPIMRNHVYRFYVGGNNTPQEIRVKVTPWGETEPKKEVW